MRRFKIERSVESLEKWKIQSERVEAEISSAFSLRLLLSNDNERVFPL